MKLRLTSIGVLPGNRHARGGSERLCSAAAEIILGNVNELEKYLA